MVHIYTFCDKTLVGKKNNLSTSFLCENLYKMNLKITEHCCYNNLYDFESLTFKNKDIYFFLMQKSSSKLNSVLANLTNCNIVANLDLKNSLTNYYKNINMPMDNSCELEWLIPEKAVPITNPKGNTQGFYIKISDTVIFVLPNNLEEFKTIYYDCLQSFLEKNFTIDFVSETYKIFGLAEKHIFEILKEQIKNKDKISVSIFSRGLDNDIVIKAKKDNPNFENYRQTIFKKLEKYIYSVQDLTMDEYLTKLLISNNPKLSLQGDLSIINILNNLNLNELKNNILSFISLPNINSKIKFGVSESVISQYGEESAEVAYNITVQAIENTNCDIAVTCLAKFDSNVVTTFIAIGNKIKIDIYKNSFQGNMDEVLNDIATTIKFYLIKKLMARDYKTI